MPLPFPAFGLYAITPDPQDPARLLEQVEAVLAAGAGVVQLRDKQGRLSRETARKLVTLCHRHRAPLIVNDDIELALEIDADGVHLGRDDAGLETARKWLGTDRIVGISCYGSLERALAAEQAGATYVAFGAFFPSTSKPEARLAPLTLLHQARRRLRCPIVAIGGITLANASRVIEAGADLTAVIGGLFHTADPGQTARRFAALWTGRCRGVTEGRTRPG